MSTAAVRSPLRLLTVVVALSVAVTVMGGVVLALKLRPEAVSSTPQAQSLRHWRDVVAAHPKSAAARTGLGLVLLDLNRAADARRAFEQALRLDPKAWQAAFQLASLVRSTDARRAVRLLRDAAVEAPPSAKAGPYLVLGEIRFAAHDLAGAKDAYEHAVADAPFVIDCRVGLARVDEASGDVNGALDQYRQAARFDPGNTEINAAVSRLEAATTVPPTGRSDQ